MTKPLKQKSNQRDDNIKTRVSNKWLYYMVNGLGSFIHKLREIRANNPTSKTNKHVGRMLYLMMKKNNIPIHWGESFTKLVTNIDKSEPPDHEYLSLKIGNHYIQSSSFDKEKVEKMKGQELSIAINGQVSKTEIKEFLDRHNDLIKEIYNLLGLQKTKLLGDPTFHEQFLTKIIKNKPGITNREIHKFVSNGMPDDLGYSRKRTKSIKNNSSKLDIL